MISKEERGCHTNTLAILEVYFELFGNTVKKSVQTEVGADLNPDQHTFKSPRTTYQA